MRIVITGGGTGGHLSPALAVIEELTVQSQRDGWPLDLLYIGSTQGVEQAAITALGIAYRSVPVGKLRRYFSWQTPLDLGRIPLGILAARRILVSYKPDVVFSTGGFVCVPTVIAARWCGLPVVTHEQTALVGLANRIAARYADVVAISYESSRRFFAKARRVVLTGNPVRQAILHGTAEAAYARFDLDRSLPLVYITGGAQGSHVVNKAVSENLTDLLAVANLVHQCGAGPGGSGADQQLLDHQRESLPPELQRRYVVLPFVGELLADIYAAAGLVIGRAGAGTVNELAALGKPAILIPLASSAEGEQQRNAELMQQAGGAVLLLEAELSGARLVAEVRRLLAAGPQLAAMGAAATKLAVPAAAREIVGLLRELAAP